LTRGGRVGISTSGNAVNLSEEVLVEQWSELFRGVLNLVDNLGK
jgi:hypothetical protein